MTRIPRPRSRWLALASLAVAFGALLHLAALAAGPEWLGVLGAPPGLVQMMATGAMRPIVTTAAIAGVLLLMSAYGLAAAGVLRWRLPMQRTVLFLFGAGLLVRGIVMPVVAAWEPQRLHMICGRCDSLNGFVLLTSALCLAVGAIYLASAARPREPR
jgi:hypothetical protein